MPIYEYQCSACKKISSFLLLRVTEEVEPYCKHCGDRRVTRVLSAVHVLRGEEKRIEGLLDPSRFSGLDENDPASIEKTVKRLGRDLGGEIGEGWG
ncbi:MAG: Zinc ribbon domain protein [Syntrophorhabdus sp. PtaU1.Bin058]|nr:MAG: Zinc ribbon domain protein [Syntrophorhabdus sp. PtaU1.Bin058]